MKELSSIIISPLIIALLCIFFSWLMYRSNRDIDGIRQLAIGTAVYQIGQILVMAQPLLPLWLGSFVANHVFLLALLYMLSGILYFFGQRLSLRLTLPGCMIFSLLLTYFTYAEPDVDKRIMLVSLMYIVMMALMISIIARYRGNNYSIAAILFYTIASICILIMLYRLGYLFFIGSLGNITNGKLAHNLIIGLSLFFSYSIMLGFFLLCNERQMLHIRQLQQRAEDMVMEKSQLLTFLSHELRTPLNAIVGKAQLIASQTTNPTLRYDCELITEAGMELSVITQQVLIQAEAENTQSLAVPEPIWLANWLKRLIDIYQPLAMAKNLELALKLNDLPTPYVMLNKTKLRQILTNLISNAIKYSEQGKVTLSVSHSSLDKNYTFNVIDQGVGIAEHEQNKILHPFSRADNSLHQEGYGLGLALTQQILRTLNSQLYFYSKSGHGSHFYFSLPLPPATTQSKEVLIHNHPVPVLVIEDIPLNHLIIEEMLRQDGHQPDCVTTLATARKYLKQHHYELIILDLNLPDGDGLTFFKELQQTHINPPEVIILTADTSQSLRDDCLAAGINTVIYKPLSLQTLRQTIATIQAATVPPVLQLANSNTFLQTAIYLPEERIHKKLQKLSEELSDLINRITLPPLQSTQQQLHKLTSTASTLGLEKLTKVSRRLEQQLDLLDQDMINYLHNLAQHSCTALKEKIEA